MRSKLKSYNGSKRTNAYIALTAVVTMIVCGSLLVRTHAATFFASVNPTQGTVATNATVATDSSALGGKSIRFNAPASDGTGGGGGGGGTTITNPSGQAMPGATSGYKQVCAEDFNTTAATGSWGTTSASKVVYTGGCKWVEYPDGWPSTFTNSAAGYAPSKVLSVHDGQLDFSLANVNGKAQGANPSPILSSGSQYQTYGEYIFRVKFPNIAGYHNAWLLWPQNDSDWQCAETDFPEMDYTETSITAFAHYGCSGSQDALSKKIDITQWHTYKEIWTSTSRSFYVDDTLVGTTTKSIFTKSERLQLQVEPSGSGPGGSGHVLVDWVAIYAPN